MDRKSVHPFDCSRNSLRRCILIVSFVFILVCAGVLSSCGLGLNIENIGDVIEANISGILPSQGLGFGGLQPPDGQEVHEIGSSKDLFYTLQDSLYSFAPDVYLKVEEYSMFSRYWDELTLAGALHSAFQIGQVQIEYDNRTPCTIRIRFAYNHAGSVMSAFFQSPSSPEFTSSEQTALFRLINKVIDETITEDMDDFEKIIAVHDYLVVNSVYTDSEEASYLATALSILENGQGQCQGYSEAFAAIMIISGVETRVISGKAFDSEMHFVPHAWNQVKVDGVWYHVDVTWNDPIPDTGKSALHTYLLRSDEFFENDHLWSDYFPKCPTDRPLPG